MWEFIFKITVNSNLMKIGKKRNDNKHHFE